MCQSESKSNIFIFTIIGIYLVLFWGIIPAAIYIFHLSLLKALLIWLLFLVKVCVIIYILVYRLTKNMPSQNKPSQLISCLI